MMEEQKVSAITDRFYIILQECFTERDAYDLVNENNRRPREKRLDFVASNGTDYPFRL